MCVCLCLCSFHCESAFCTRCTKEEIVFGFNDAQFFCAVLFSCFMQSDTVRSHSLQSSERNPMILSHREHGRCRSTAASCGLFVSLTWNLTFSNIQFTECSECAHLMYSIYDVRRNQYFCGAKTQWYLIKKRRRKKELPDLTGKCLETLILI